MVIALHQNSNLINRLTRGQMLRLVNNPQRPAPRHD